MTANLLTLNLSKNEFLLIVLKQQLAKISCCSLDTAHSARNFIFIFDEHILTGYRLWILPFTYSGVGRIFVWAINGGGVSRRQGGEVQEGNVLPTGGRGPGFAENFWLFDFKMAYFDAHLKYLTYFLLYNVKMNTVIWIQQKPE